MPGRLMLLDSASLYFRAFYGIPDRFETADGTPVNALRGFVDMVARLIADYRPDLLVACWDNDWRPAFRVELLPSYKAHRVAGADPKADQVPAGQEGAFVEEVPDRLAPQESLIGELLAAVGIARVGVDGFEADDVIGQFARDHAGPVLVVTGDRDLFQLVDADKPVRVLYTGRGMRDLQVVDDDWLRTEYGVDGSQYSDMALLRGDASDGLPGVRGVGQKTASALLGRHGTVGSILRAAADPTSDMTPSIRRRMLAAQDYLKVADPVVRLDHRVPVPPTDMALPTEPRHPQRFVDLVDRTGIESGANRLLTALAPAPPG